MDKNSIGANKNEARSLFKKCFKNQMFSHVPYEIWRDLIVSNGDLKTIFILSETCYAFKKIVDNIGENNFNLALMFRKEGLIDLAKKYIQKCAESNNPTSLFHLGYAFFYGGWGLEEETEKAAECFKKSAELGSPHAMALYSFCLTKGYGAGKDEGLGNIWAKKALCSNNYFAIGFCLFYGLGLERDFFEAFHMLEKSANEGDEFGEDILSDCFFYGYGVKREHEKALYWNMKFASKGSCRGQYMIGYMYLHGRACEKDKEKAFIWFKKSAKQEYSSAKDELRNLEQEDNDGDE